MELRSKGKVLFLALAVCMVFSIVFTEFFAADDHEHDCIGEGCPICLQIQTAAYFLKILKMAGITVFSAFVLVFLIKIPLKHTDFTPCPHSSVTLKVRINT